MILRVSIALCSLLAFVVGHPLLEATNETAVPEGIYIREANGVQRRAKVGIEQELLDKFILYSEYCSAAYCGPQQGKAGGKVSCGIAKTCPKVEALDTKIYSTWFAKDSSGATGFVSVDKTNKLIVLAMRGSVSVANWAADAKATQTKCDEIVPKSHCSTGFLAFWKESKEKALQGVKAAVVDHPEYNFIVTGHSLGGAAAVLATIEMRRMYGKKRVTMYTYGQPRAGDEILSQYITNQGQNYRITHTSDAVPKLPPEGSAATTGVYKHLSPEYWISDGLGNKKDKIKVVEGLSSNEGNAGTGQMNFNIVAHIQYFQTNMYYCAMPFPLGIYGGAGSKRSIEGAEEDSITKRGVEGDMGEEGNEGADVLPHVRVLDGKGVHGQVGSEKRELQKSSRWDAETKVEDLVAMGLGQGILTEYIDVGL
ncbi:hypothetical protein EG328_003775 [Venturia inaequalis]|uniref:Fungal lipase-type domain-containing protein n=1 Tax=Venturia inaequalis TaxID=5025 RepID=A0A8H3YWK4_VENIN|nr:hypothetical protein EG328_003775 [Venturia inaequalis]